MGKTPRRTRTLDHTTAENFGKYIRRLRKERGHTQEQLAELAELASDTIRRLEQGTFSPSLDTLSKLTRGLRLDFTTLFAAFEHGNQGREWEIRAMGRTMDPADLALALRLLAFLVSLLSTVAAERAAEQAEDGGAGE